MHPKVKSAVAATPVVVVLVWALQVLGLDVPVEVAAAMGALLAGLAGWLTPPFASRDAAGTR